MLRLPRDIAGDDLIRALGKVGYRATRQNGSHVRLTAALDSKEHHVTIPLHDPLKTGTLAAILADVATFLQIDRNELISRLFG